MGSYPYSASGAKSYVAVFFDAEDERRGYRYANLPLAAMGACQSARKQRHPAKRVLDRLWEEH